LGRVAKILGRVGKILLRAAAVEGSCWRDAAAPASRGSRIFQRARVSGILRKLPIGAVWAGRKLALWVARSHPASLAASALTSICGRRALLLKGTLSQLRHRNDDHAFFWAEAENAYPDDPSILRMRVHSALRSGDVATASSQFSLLVASGKTQIGDARFVVGLSNVNLQKNRISSIRSRVRQFLATQRGRRDSRVAAVRLCRLIFAHFPRTECASAPEIRARFLHLLDRSPVATEPKKLLGRVVACEERLARLYPSSLFDSDISAPDRRAFITLVRQRLHERRPFAFVRLGDGEAACLPYEHLLALFAAPDRRDRERIWWGKPLECEVRSRLYPRLTRAMFDADCIGIPTVSRFIRELRLERNDTLETSLTGRGLRAVLNCAENWDKLRSPGIAPPVFTSCHLHQDLELWNCYDELLHGLRDVVLVSCHERLADWMEQRFDLKIAGHVCLPPDRVTGPYLAKGYEGPSLPTHLDDAIAQLGDLPRNRLVLVGAGILGKLFVNEARARGGIALDIGSIFDHWLGLRTRSYLDLNIA